MSWVGLLALLACLASAGALGYRAAATVLGAPTRLSRAALGSGVGVVALGLPLLWTPRAAPVGDALLVSGACCALGLLALRRRTVPAPRREGRLAAAGLAAVSALACVSALAFWVEGTAGRADVGTLYMHSGLAAGIARGNFPVINPFEPDFALQYRVTMHTLAAGAVDLLDARTPQVMPFVVPALALALVWTLYGALVRVVGAGWALGAAAAAYAWGPLYWALTPAAIRERGLGDVLGVIAAAPDSIAWSGVLLGGPFTMPTHNPTVLHGLIPAIVVIAAVTRAVDGGGAQAPAWAAAGAALVYLAASNEYLLITVPLGLGLWIGLRRPFAPRQALRRVLPLAALSAAALLLSQTTSGVLNGALARDSDLGRLGVGLNTSHAGALPSWGFNSAGPWAEWPAQGWHDTPIWSLEFLIDGGLLFWLLAAALVWLAWRRGRSGAAPWMLAAAVSAAIALAFRLEASAPNLNRLAHAGFTLTVPALAIAAAEAWPRARPARLAAGAGAALLGLALCGAFVLSAVAWPRMASQTPAAADGLPAGTRDFLLRETSVQDRLLIVHGAATTVQLYDHDRQAAITLDVLAETGQFIPFGYHDISRADEYTDRYHRAQHQLASGELASLEIRYVLADPARLTERQANAIGRLRADGRLTEAYRDPSGRVVVYAVRG